MSLGMFSRFPFVGKIWNEDSLNLVIPMFPIVGLIVGAIMYLFSYIIVILPIHIMLKSVLIMFGPLICTGLIHLDGFMDTIDAVSSNRDLEQKKQILKDPHPGAFSIVAIVMLFLLQFACYYATLDQNILPHTLLIFIPIMSRGIVGICLLAMKPMSETGFGVMFKTETKKSSYIIITLILTACALYLFFWRNIYLLIPISICFITGFLVCLFLCRHFSGISGDLCGCAIVISETFSLVALSLLGGII